MSIRNKIANFVIMEASWVTWLLIGYSTGGIGVAVARAITLIRSSVITRRVSDGGRPHRPCDSSPALALSSGW